jgi:hypothetical protein
MATLTAMLPPALSPTTATLAGSPPQALALASTHFQAATLSSWAAGNLASGAWRYSIETTMAPVALARARGLAS